MNDEWGYENYFNEAEEELASESELNEWQPEIDELYQEAYQPANRRPYPSGGGARRSYSAPYCIEVDYFALNSATVPQRHLASIKALAERIVASLSSRSPVTAVRITGHTDKSAGDDYNLQLGQRRAQSVGSLLRQEMENRRPGSSHRVRFSIDSLGESQASSQYDPRSRKVVICLTSAYRPPQYPPPYQPTTCPPCPPQVCHHCGSGGGNMQCFIAVQRTIFTAIRNLKAVAAACRRKSPGCRGGNCGHRR